MFLDFAFAFKAHWLDESLFAKSIWTGWLLFRLLMSADFQQFEQKFKNRF